MLQGPEKDTLSLKLRELKEELIRRGREAFYTWEPYFKRSDGDPGWQWEFMLAAADYEHRLALGANRIGKSELGAFEVALAVTGKHPFYEYPAQGTAWVVGLDNAMIRDICRPLFEKFIPEKFKFDYHKQDNIWYCQADDRNWQVVFKSTEMGMDKFQGAKIDLAWIDDTLITMSDGTFKLVRDVKVGDKVISMQDRRGPGFCSLHTGTVFAVGRRGYHQVVKVKVRGVELKLTKEHPLWVSGKGWVNACQVKKNDKLYMPLVENAGKDKGITEGMAFVAGCMVGDGYIAKSRLQFTCLNPCLLREFEENLFSCFTNVRLSKQGDRQYRICRVNVMRKNGLKSFLERCTLIGTHAHSKFIPSCILQSSEKVRKSFLRGLFSCDGWYQHHGVGFASTSKRLAYEVFLLLRGFGMKPSVFYRKSQKRNWRDQWHIFLNRAEDVIDFINDIGMAKNHNKTERECLRRLAKYGSLSRKDRALNSRKNRRCLATVTNVQMGLFEEVYNLSVTGYQNYIANGFLCHNCWIDEEPKKTQIFSEIEARLIDLRGRWFMTATPIKGTAWLKGLAEREDVFITFAGMKENPYLPIQEVEAYARTLSEDERRVRIEGEYVIFAGRPVFERSILMKTLERARGEYYQAGNIVAA